jgi:hypothetical protein
LNDRTVLKVGYFTSQVTFACPAAGGEDEDEDEHHVTEPMGGFLRWAGSDVTATRAAVDAGDAKGVMG